MSALPEALVAEPNARRRRSRPRGWRADPGWRGIAVAASALFVLWAGSFPTAYELGALVSATFTFGPALVYTWISKPYPVADTTPRRRWICWGSLAAVASLLVFPWPMWLRFASARAALDRAAAEVRAGRPVEPRRAGLLELRRGSLTRRVLTQESGDPAHVPVLIETHVGGFLHSAGERPDGSWWVEGWWDVVQADVRLASTWYADSD